MEPHESLTVIFLTFHVIYIKFIFFWACISTFLYYCNAHCEYICGDFIFFLNLWFGIFTFLMVWPMSLYKVNKTISMLSKMPFLLRVFLIQMVGKFQKSVSVEALILQFWITFDHTITWHNQETEILVNKMKPAKNSLHVCGMLQSQGAHKNMFPSKIHVAKDNQHHEISFDL